MSEDKTDYKELYHSMTEVVARLEKRIAELEKENKRLKIYGHRNCTIENCEFDGAECWNWRHVWASSQ